MTSSTAGPPHRVQSATVEYGYPQGHLGHLDVAEEAALRKFKALVIEKGLYKPASETHEFGTHDDAMLLRFLRARRFNVTDAFIQFKDTEDWRAANQLDTLYETIDLEQYDQTRKLYPQWTGRRDRRGIPVYVYEVKHLNAKMMSEYEKSAAKTHHKAVTDGKTAPKLLRLFALYENLVRFVMPLCTALPDRENNHTPITQSNNIVDISGVGLKQFWNLRTHMQDASTLATAHYPETLDRIFIIGAPSFFPTVWSWIKRWFDPITTSKIFIISSSEVKSTLESFIDPANIPVKYGGQLKYKFGDLPLLDPAYKDYIKWEGSHTEFPYGPLMWVDRGDSIELISVGSVDGKDRREEICSFKKVVKSASLDEELTTEAAPATITHGKSEVQTDAIVGAGSMLNLEKTETSATTPKVITEKPESSELAVQNGEVVPASRPAPVSFTTARNGLNTLSINDEKHSAPAESPVPDNTQTHMITPESAAPTLETIVIPDDSTTTQYTRPTTASSTGGSLKSRDWNSQNGHLKENGHHLKDKLLIKLKH